MFFRHKLRLPADPRNTGTRPDIYQYNEDIADPNSSVGYSDCQKAACGAGGYRLEGSSPYEGVLTWRVLRWALVPAAVLAALALLVYFTSANDSTVYDPLYPLPTSVDTGPRLVTLEGEHFSLDETKVTYHLPDAAVGGRTQPAEQNSTVRVAEVFEIVPETDVEMTESERFDEGDGEGEEEEEDFDTSESKPATLSDRRPTGRPYQLAPGDRSFVDRLISSFENSRNQRPPTAQMAATRGPTGPLVSTSQGLLNRRIPNGHKYADHPVQPTEEVRTMAPPRVSPTLPSSSPTVHVVSMTSMTAKQINDSDSSCASPRLSLCRGVLPWDLTATTPMVPGLPSLADLDAVMPYFEMLASTGCSPRIRPFLCSLLEPECRSVGYNILPPCRKACRAVEEECRDFILDSLDLSQVFNCDFYPDSNNQEECVNLAKGEKCLKNEFQCSDGSCIPWRWACNKARDCPLGEDETNCTQCTQDEFRCAIDHKCIPIEWKCDRRKDCSDGSDEFNCKMTEVAMAHSHTSPCPSGELRCVDGRCITLAQICDRVHDCSDGADEANCPPPHPT